MLFEKHDTNNYLAEIPYGFKNLWRISVSAYDLKTQSFEASSIRTVILNGNEVQTSQLIQLFDYNRDGCSLFQTNAVSGLYATLTGYDPKTSKFSFQALIEQDFNIQGVLTISGEVVDNSDPLNPVILHDDQKLDAEVYEDNKTVVTARLTKHEADIIRNKADIVNLQENVITSITVNENEVPVSEGTAQISIDAVGESAFKDALALKVDKSVSGDSSGIVQNIESSFDSGTRTVTVEKTFLSLEDGSKELISNEYQLAEMLGITDLESKERELFYFCPVSAVASYSDTAVIELSSLYRFKADETIYKPSETDDIQMIYAIATDYTGYGRVGRSYVSAIGRVTSLTANTVNCVFTNLMQYTIYNKYNSYAAGTIVYDLVSSSIYQVVQNVSTPTSESDTIPLTNSLYFLPAKDYSKMPAGTILGNFDTTEGPGTSHTIQAARTKLLEVGAGYDEYVSFLSDNIPQQILTDADWNNNISLWITDGLQFTSREALLEYLNSFKMVERYKISNRGIIITHYEQGGITITPVFTKNTLNLEFLKKYQPIPGATATGNMPVYDTSNVLVDSGKAPTDFATASQGEKADSAIQTVILSGGTINGAVRLKVNDNDQEEVQVTGLKSAAYKESTEFATAAQGAKADSAIQSVSLSPGTINGNIRLSVNDNNQEEVQVTGLKSAAYKESTEFATAAQGTKADSAIQASDVVNNLSSTDAKKPLSANQGRILEQLIQTIGKNGKPIGGFKTFSDAYKNTSQYPDDLQPIGINDTIYIDRDENHTDEHAQWKVSSIASDGTITYVFVRIVPDAERDFITSPIKSNELAEDTVNTQHLQNGAVSHAKLADTIKESLTKADRSVQDVSFAGEGNVLTDATISGNTVVFSKGKVLTEIITAGNGNVITDITQEGEAVKGTVLSNIKKMGSGNVVTGVNVENGEATLSTGTAVMSVSTAGTGNMVGDVSVSGGEMKVTKTNAITSLPDASSFQKGIVQLNNSLTSTREDQALTAAQGKALSDIINSNDSRYVNLEGIQTIGGIKTITNDLVVPRKTEIPVTPSSTTYATEAQVATKVTKPPTAVLNNVAVFDNNKNVVDSGKKITDFLGVNGVLPIANGGTGDGGGMISSLRSTFTQATSLVNIVSKETIATSMGKIMKAISDFIAHKGDTDVHVTAAKQAAWDAGTTIATNDKAGIVKGNADEFMIGSDGKLSMTASFTAQSTLTAITGTENKKTLFGKIAKSVSSLISHMADKTIHFKTTNNLLATVAGTALDAMQGKALDDKITDVNRKLTLTDEYHDFFTPGQFYGRYTKRGGIVIVHLYCTFASTGVGYADAGLNLPQGYRPAVFHYDTYFDDNTLTTRPLRLTVDGKIGLYAPDSGTYRALTTLIFTAS